MAILLMSLSFGPFVEEEIWSKRQAVKSMNDWDQRCIRIVKTALSVHCFRSIEHIRKSQ
jgi:hypothetical protein